MPNGNTFEILPVQQLLAKWLPTTGIILDPFSNGSQIGNLTNDIREDRISDYHLDAHDFIDIVAAIYDKADAVLFDPPYSNRQLKEMYQNSGHLINRWTELKNKITLVLKPGSIAISFGWSSTGFGKKRCFSVLEYKLLNRGAGHNDTIITVERYEP